MRSALPVAMVAVLATCGGTPIEPPDLLPLGTWGGENAGVIVTDSVAHVHVGCTYGDIPGLVPIDDDGRFTAQGTYILRAYPIVLGPTLPAVFIGRISGSTLRLTVIVSDTTAGDTKTLGPVTVQLGKDPRLGPCPICRVPANRSMGELSVPAAASTPSAR